jgi:hypothetical protein
MHFTVVGYRLKQLREDDESRGGDCDQDRCAMSLDVG